MQLFYAPDFQSTMQLPENEVRHCFKVLRKKDGDIINIIDGKGNLFECKIEGDKLHLLSTTKEFGKRDSYLHLAIAPTKNMDRMEWLIEKATEIGVDEVSFIQCSKSERNKIKLDRLERKAVSAMKQSLSAYLPKLNELVDFKNFIEKPFHGNKYIAHLSDKADPLIAQEHDNKSLILIGPEGDFSGSEIELALQNGFREISLGKKRLRTETAGLSACVLLNN